MFSTTTLLIIGTIILLYLFYDYVEKNELFKKKPRFFGPKALPILGNAMIIMQKNLAGEFPINYTFDVFKIIYLTSAFLISSTRKKSDEASNDLVTFFRIFFNKIYLKISSLKY